MKASTLVVAVLVVAAAAAAAYVLTRDTACAGWSTAQVRQIVLQELKQQAPVDPAIPDAYDAAIDESAITYAEETWVVPITVTDRLGTRMRFLGSLSCLGNGTIGIAKLAD
ncbi:hypothetical protein [Chthonobacter rhizosphaerae]|uniref:hypothetical protein n=1 Tax=Chthonobacter rhizosphaerae TaxID=2735553 RepID=UPI0015EE6E7E|nr:hypothetical protein [Chthonobacter rhizosphaerae]